MTGNGFFLTPLTGVMTIPEDGGRIQLLTMSHIDSQKAFHLYSGPLGCAIRIANTLPQCTRMRG